MKAQKILDCKVCLGIGCKYCDEKGNEFVLEKKEKRGSEGRGKQAEKSSDIGEGKNSRGQES